MLREDNSDKKFYIGVDNAGDREGAFKDPLWLESLKFLGVEFIMYHYVPRGTVSEQVAFIRGLSKLCESNNIQFVLNTERINWLENFVDDDGWDWCHGTDGLHYMNFKPEIMQALSESTAFAGLVLDEADHMQLHRSWVWQGTVSADTNIANQETKKNMVFLGDTNSLSLPEAEQLVLANGKRLVEEWKASGTHRIITEHVFPVLFHSFAEAGMTPACKQMKESWSNVWMACAMGAARQYERELWTCLDLWLSDRYPGHSPEELRNNLLFGYWAGVDRMYVENLNYEGSLVEIVQDDGVPVNRLTKWGEQLQWFARQYLPANPRAYTFRDMKPEIAIIRFDDTDYGQAGEPFWPEWLYGSETLTCTPATSHWLKIWNVISHGVIPDNSLSWNTAKYSEIPHRSFAPMNGVIVYDHKAGNRQLAGLKLAFLSGIMISDGTMEAIAKAVEHHGLVVVAPPELVPEFVYSGYKGGTCVQSCGNGKWIVTDNVQSDELREEISTFLGSNDEIRYLFGDEEILFKIGVNDELELVKRSI